MSAAYFDVVQRVREYLDSQSWKYSIEDNQFKLDFSTDNQLEECTMYIGFVEYNDSACGVYTKTICPLSIPEEKEDEIKEFMARANYGMADGYFSWSPSEDDPAEKRVEYNSWLVCSDVIPSLRDVESSVDFPLQIMMAYGDALFNVLKHNANPNDELQRMEG